VTTLPAQQLQMGSTHYFLSSIPARELVMVVRPASEALPDWNEMSIEDRIQRDINLKRLHDEVIPYLASHPDRFFGAVIVLVTGRVDFEKLTELGVQAPKAYEGSLEKFGFLTITGGEWIALDGQHRLVALREIFLGKFDGEIQAGLPNEDVIVIFIENESIQKTRRIFNKVNRYARSTSRADNLILSEDDGYAIISRKLFTEESGVLHSRDPRVEQIVNWKNNTLSNRSLQLTTISALSLIVKDICEANGILLDEKTNGGVAPSAQLIVRGKQICEQWIENAFKEFEILEEARRNAGVLPANRELDKPFSLLLKPAGQISLFRAARKAKEIFTQRFNPSEFFRRASHVDWRVVSENWDNLLVMGGYRIMAKNSGYEDAALMILWQVYGNLSVLPPELQEAIEKRWAIAHANEPRGLPDPLPREVGAAKRLSLLMSTFTGSNKEH
jgi:DNA sulfur modification protein DndB